MRLEDSEGKHVHAVASTVRTAFVHSICPVFLVFFLLSIAPRFEAAFLKKQVLLPYLTQVAINISSALRSGAPEVWLILISAYFADIAVYYLLRRELGSIVASIWSGGIVILQLCLCFLLVTAFVFPAHSFLK